MKLPYAKGQFEQCLYLQQVLSLIEDRSERLSALRELQRVIKNDGVAYISFLFKESREKTIFGFLLTWYLRIFRLLFGKKTAASLQPWLKHGGRFNWSAFIDAPPYVYWCSLEEALRDVGSSGLKIVGIASDAQLEEGRWLSLDDLKDKPLFKGFLYLKCLRQDVGSEIRPEVK